MRTLRDLGFSETAEKVYLNLLDGQPVDVMALAEDLSVDPIVVSGALSELQQVGLIAADGADLVASPPRIPLEVMASKAAGQAAGLRDCAEQLAARWNTEHSVDPDVRVITREQECDALSEQIHDHATTLVRALSIGPVRPDAVPTVQRGSVEALRRGVNYHVVYGAQILQIPAALDAVQSSIAAGEQARVVQGVPVNLIIGEDYALLLYPSPDRTGRHQLQINRRSALYDVLVALSENYWWMAAPLSPTAMPEHDLAAPLEAARQLLSLLTVGLTDEAIARELDVSERTVARRVSALQQQLGARSRFQLGMQAARFGWI